MYADEVRSSSKNARRWQNSNTCYIRKSIHANPGEELCLSVNDDGKVKLQSRLNALKEAQAYFAQFQKDGESVVEEFLREKRE
ncbi:MAG: hypothetical protein JWQ09_4648 [Segetibacter sp.]|nr:hypothetical protein [Segetibacter sp.]